MNAGAFDSVETLANGTVVRIRAIRPDDKAAVVEAFERLGSASVYSRFFHAKGSVTDEELIAVTEVDFENDVALVATVESRGEERIVGAGRYLTIDPGRRPGRAEVAFLVAEDFRGQGISSRILDHLARIAAGKGIGQFEAEVLPTNQAMLAVFSRTGFPMERRRADGTLHVTLTLPEPDAGSEGGSGAGMPSS
jgi:RimJ/RimL family protein N-acetyltransferase